MCKCTPEVRTMYCGKGDCVWPDSKPEGTRLAPNEDLSFLKQEVTEAIPPEPSENDVEEPEMVTVSKEFLENIQSTMWFARTFVHEKEAGGKELVQSLENLCNEIVKVIK